MRARKMNSEKCALLVLILCVVLIILHFYWNYDDRVRLSNFGRGEESRRSGQAYFVNKIPRDVTFSNRPVVTQSLPTKARETPILGLANNMKPIERDAPLDRPAKAPRTFTKLPDPMNIKMMRKEIKPLDIYTDNPNKKTGKNEKQQLPPFESNSAEVNIDVNKLIYPTRKRRQRKNETDMGILQEQIKNTLSPPNIIPTSEKTPVKSLATIPEGDLSKRELTTKGEINQSSFANSEKVHVEKRQGGVGSSAPGKPVTEVNPGDLLSVKVLYHLQTDPYKGYWVHAEGDLHNRTHMYNAAIEQIRAAVLKDRGFKSWQDVNQTSIQVQWGSYDDFHEKISKRSEVTTIYLPWIGTKATSERWNSLGDNSNVYIKKYYPWVATQPLCLWIETPGLTRARWDAVYNRTCHQDFNLLKTPKSLDVVYLHGKPINKNHYWPNDGDFYPANFYTTVPKFVYYLHIMEDAIITPPGDMISGKFKLVPYTCAHDINRDVPQGYENTPIYKEVFILTQFWGNQFFHRMIEMIPRLLPYLEFLKANSEIMVSIPGEDTALREFLTIFGISSERTVIGMVRAKVAYMPRGTPCGFALVQETQLFSHVMRDYVKNNLFPRRRNKIVMIRRSGLRQFRYNDHIQKTLRELANEYKLDLYVFRDDPTPSLQETMKVFYEAIMVVGPHGAGLSNLIFSQPGTLVMEGVCNPPHVNMCFQRVAHILGHRYHGVPSRAGCENEVQIYPEVIDFIARKYLELLSEDNDLGIKSS